MYPKKSALKNLKNSTPLSVSLSLVLTFALTACGKKGGETSKDAIEEPPPYCANANPSTRVAGSTGVGLAFDVNPAVTANNPNLLPTSSLVNSSSIKVQLERLHGYGTLNGELLDVRSGACTGAAIGAYNTANEFNYEHSDPRFAEVMSYYYGDQYRQSTKEAGVLLPEAPIYMIANCNIKDNAFFTREEQEDGSFENFVCLGKSSVFASQKATFADDAQVVIHELQHAQTTYSYSSNLDLNQFEYDEAGVLNEGVSDAVGLMQTYERIKSPFDVRTFSLWGLGRFFGTQGDASRGAHRCPTYDPSFPNCAKFKPDATGFSADQNTISFTYPDGLGWPYAGFYSGSTAVKRAFLENASHQEIHQGAIIIAGALFEAFETLLDSRSGDVPAVRMLMLKIISRAVQRLEKPNALSKSPVNLPMMYSGVVEAAEFYGVSPAELAKIKVVGEERGLYNAPVLGAAWAKVIGHRFYVIVDKEKVERPVKRGEKGWLWFNIQNKDALTAGGVMVDVKITDADPAIRIVTNPEANPGTVSATRAMIPYGKINGTAIVAAMQSADPAKHVPLTNDYFGTYSPIAKNASFDASGIAIQVSKTAPAGTHHFTLRLTPANGPVEEVPYTIEVLK